MRVSVGECCRRCGTLVSMDAEPFTHILILHTDHGPREVSLLMCRPCGAEFSTLRDRDEYARLAYFG